MTEQALLLDVPAYAGVEDENHRFTTPEAAAWCRGKAGVTDYDLDVAACAESHLAPVWYGRTENGLVSPWFGDVFCNPPWDDIGPWVLCAWKAWREVVSPTLISISMLLPGNRTHRDWWQQLVEQHRDGRCDPHHPARLSAHFAPKRFAYGHPGNPRAVGVAEPNFTSVLLVWRLK